MSLIPVAAGAAVLAGLNLINSVLFSFRNIGPLVADVTVEESHHDEAIITEHPVEQSANITDHAYKRPVTVMIRAGWSNSSPRALLNPNYVKAIYQELLDLQESFGPFDITTGKRDYQNMLIRRLHVVTDERSEFALNAAIECQEVILTSTQLVTVPPAGQQRSPQLTNPPVNAGAQSLGPPGNFRQPAFL